MVNRDRQLAGAATPLDGALTGWSFIDFNSVFYQSTRACFFPELFCMIPNKKKPLTVSDEWLGRNICRMIQNKKIGPVKHQPLKNTSSMFLCYIHIICEKSRNVNKCYRIVIFSGSAHLLSTSLMNTSTTWTMNS